MKYLAVLSMIIDHCAFNFYYAITPGSIMWQIMHFIGRLADPIMAYFIAEGYIHTHNVNKYLLRLAVFTLISWLPFNLFVYGSWPHANLGVIFTLMLGLIAIYFWDKGGKNIAVRLSVIVLLCFLSRYGDWKYVNVLWPLLFFVFRDDGLKKWLSYYVVACIEIVILLYSAGAVQINQAGLLMFPAVMIFCYDGMSGSKSNFHKWFFFAFYPLHMIILWLLR